MKIGVTSQNFKTITGHAGKTRRFLVFSESLQGEWYESKRIDLPKDHSMHEFKGGPHPLDDLDVLITGSCGEGFIRKLNSRGVQVIATSETDPSYAVNRIIEGLPLAQAQPHVHLPV
jgi:predicted Fe-Mo cluster-binding NifX family protein